MRAFPVQNVRTGNAGRQRHEPEEWGATDGGGMTQVDRTQANGQDTFVVVQTVAEAGGFPARVPANDVPLPPMGLPLASIARLVILPYCELLSWPLTMVRSLLGGSPKPSA